MEGKNGAAAIAALCMLLLLLTPPCACSSLGDVNCECYRQCYPGCKDITPPWLCKFKCACGCPLTGPGIMFDSLAVCLDACDTDSICDLPAPLVDARACEAGCFVRGAPSDLEELRADRPWESWDHNQSIKMALICCTNQ